MNDAAYSDNFRFVDFHLSRYHYTDSRDGAARHYLALMLRGECRIVAGKDTLSICEGDVFYIPKGLSYQSFWYGRDEIRFLSFGFGHLLTDEAEDISLQVIPCSEDIREKLRSISTGGHPDCRPLSVFYSVMADLLPTMIRTPERREDTVVRRAETYIEDHPDCSMAELAAACSVSEPYLYVIFHRTTGQTPNTFRQKILCRKAVQLLTTTDRTVEEIASALSFSSASYMRKVLRQHTGHTPRQIRSSRVI